MMDVLAFREHLLGCGLSETTAHEYGKWLRRFLLHCAEHGLDAPTCPSVELRRWADGLPRSWATRKQARSALQRYYQAVGRTDEPWQAIRVPRKPRPRYRGLSAGDAALLRDAALMIGGRRGLATLIGMYTGARASEIAGLRWDGVDRGKATIRWWRPKTSEWHSVPLHPLLAEVLAAQDPGHGGPVFAGNNGRSTVGPGTVWTWVRSVGELAGVSVSPHQLRATAGTFVLEATKDLDATAEFLGHRDISVTRMHYTMTSEQRLQAAVQSLDY